MGTRCMIGYWNSATNEVIASYCHYDGYIMHTGANLVRHYNDDLAALMLSTSGYLSHLDIDLSTSLSAAVHKDVPPVMYGSIDDYLKHGFVDSNAGFLYLWDSECWYVAPVDEALFTDVDTMLEELKLNL